MKHTPLLISLLFIVASCKKELKPPTSSFSVKESIGKVIKESYSCPDNRKSVIIELDYNLFEPSYKTVRCFNLDDSLIIKDAYLVLDYDYILREPHQTDCTGKKSINEIVVNKARIF